uniref:Spire-type actin nucleation factor 2 n=1 Tax=Neogobius melanostomus TaxID=47308 RepID=A0A8C6U2E1_9GOBI
MARSSSTGADGEKSRAPADRSELRELSLEEVLKSYEQPINEEQAWAVCFQCCSGLRPPRPLGPVIQLSSILLHRDGRVTLRPDCLKVTTLLTPACSRCAQVVRSLGVAIYRALDWGLDASEERELSSQLEQLIEHMAGPVVEVDCSGGSGASDEGYGGPEEEEQEEVGSLAQVMGLCLCRLADPTLASEHYQAVCRALFLETLELQTFLMKIHDAKETLKKISTEESEEDTAELDALKHCDWARLWVQLMKDLRQGVKLKQVQETPFHPLPSEFSLTPFEMLLQDIRTRKFQLRKVMVDGDIPTRVKRNAHELILDFIRSRPPLKPVSERALPPLPLQQPTLHEQVLALIKQERKLRPVLPSTRPFGSLPCLAQPCSCQPKSSSCMDLSVSRPRVLLKAPTLAEMEELNSSESSPVPLKRDRSFSEQDVALLRAESSVPLRVRTLPTQRPRHSTGVSEGSLRDRAVSTHTVAFPAVISHSPRGKDFDTYLQNDGRKCTFIVPSFLLYSEDEFSHPVESLALTVDEVINVRRVLVKAEMEKYLQSKELYNNLKKGKVCCCCRVRFPLLSWPSSCLFCRRYYNHSMKIPSKKLAHIPVYAVGFHVVPKGHVRRAVEEEFPHLYAHGCSLRDVCSDCTKFVADVISSSRRSLDILNTPKRDLKTAAPPARGPPPAVP